MTSLHIGTAPLEIAQLTASWCNAQPWLLHIASGSSLARFSEALLSESADKPARPDMPFPGISFGYEDSSHPANAFRVGRASTSDTVVWVDDDG
jgi:hypothetical protein